MRKSVLVLFTAMAAALSACGSAQSTGGSAVTSSQSGSLATTQIVTLAEQVFPKVSFGAYYGVCGEDGNVSACPYTDRLKARLTGLRGTLARAQNPSETREITAEITGPDAGIAHVKLFQGHASLDLRVVRRGGRLLVDDEICAGQQDTSVYAKFVPCDTAASLG